MEFQFEECGSPYCTICTGYHHEPTKEELKDTLLFQAKVELDWIEKLIQRARLNLSEGYTWGVVDDFQEIASVAAELVQYEKQLFNR